MSEAKNRNVSTTWMPAFAGMTNKGSFPQRRHLDRAKEYTLLWPVPEGAAVRMFCAVPLVLALASLSEIERGDEALKRGSTPKISRRRVQELFEEAKRSVGSDHELARIFGLLS